MKKIFLLLVVLLIFTIPVFAQSSNNPADYFQSYLKKGNLSIYASLGWWYGICINGGGEIVLGEWKIADIFEIDYSVGFRVLFQSYFLTNLTYSLFYFGAAPMFIIHLGITGNLDFYEGMGLGLFFSNDTYLFKEFGIGFAAVSGITWYFAKNMGLILEYAFVGWASSWGFGITLKL